MRILFVSNFYPPHELGGQGRSCQQIVEGLEERNHTAAVLTTMHGTDNRPLQENGVYRWLYLEMDFAPWLHSVTFFTSRRRRERVNLQRIERVLQQVQPDLVFVFGMWNLPRSVPAYLEAQMPGKVVYRFADYWPTLPSQHALYWQKPGRKWFSRWPKALVAQVALAMLARERKRLSLQFPHAIAVSEATRRKLVDGGIPVEDARIVYNGLDISHFGVNGAGETRRDTSRKCELLYAGRLDEAKGVDVAIRAIARLKQQEGLGEIRLSIAGSGPEEYESFLRRLARKEQVSDKVVFLGRIEPEKMPELYRQFDVLVFPSTWAEPLSRVILESMACGLAVVSSAIGGSTEVVADGENGLLFEPGDDEDLARQLLRLIESPDLRWQLGRAGERTVYERFTLRRMIDEIEQYLCFVKESTLEPEQ